MPASYVVDIYDRVSKCRVSRPPARNDESSGHVPKCRVSWPRIKNNESAGDVLKRFDLKITKSHIKMDGWLLTACYNDKFFDRVL